VIGRWIIKGEVPTDEAQAHSALITLRPGECLTYDEGAARVECHGGIGGFGISYLEDDGWEGIDVGKSLFSTIGDLRDDGAIQSGG
jgi:hypothetical protein